MPETFEKIWSDNENTTHKLDVCYRQAAGVAKKQLKLFASLLGKNSRFLVEEKQKREKSAKTKKKQKEICIQPHGSRVG